MYFRINFINVLDICMCERTFFGYMPVAMCMLMQNLRMHTKADHI